MNILPGAGRKWKVLDREPEYRCVINPVSTVLYSKSWMVPAPSDVVIESFKQPECGYRIIRHRLEQLARDPVAKGLLVTMMVQNELSMMGLL